MRLSVLAALSPLLATLVNGLYTPSSSPGSLSRRDDQCDASMEYCAADFLPVPQAVDEGIERRTPTPTATKRGLTNAERLRRRLPLNPPTRRSTSRRNQPSNLPNPKVTKRGIIQVQNKDTGAVIGYVSRSFFSGAQARYQSVDNALIVNFELDEGITSASGVRIVMENSDNAAAFPLLGLVQGRDNTNTDISSGSFHYTYIAGIALPGTAAGSPAVSSTTVGNTYSSASGTQRGSESDIWSINLTTGALAPQWINSAGTAPTTILFTQGTALYAGGDQAAFIARYPSPVTPLSYTFVEL